MAWWFVMHLLPPTPDITYLLGTQLGGTVYLLQIIEKRYMTTCQSPHPLNRLVTSWTCCQAVTHMRDDVLAPVWQCGSSVREFSVWRCYKVPGCCVNGISATLLRHLTSARVHGICYHCYQCLSTLPWMPLELP